MIIKEGKNILTRSVTRRFCIYKDPKKCEFCPHYSRSQCSEMSTPSSEYNGQIDAEYEIFWFGGDVVFASTAFFAYSSLLLFGQEFEYVWKQLARPSSWLYILIRYPALVVVFIGAGLNSYTPNCNAIDRLSCWSQTIALVATCSVQILRTYAVCGKSRPLAGLLVALCLPTMAISSLESVKTTCSSPGNLTPGLQTVQFTFDILFESVIIIATVWGTWSQVTVSKQLDLSHQTLAHSLFRNGLIYYMIFLALQMSTLVTDNLAATPNVLKINLFSAQYAIVIRFALTCQFLLELRERSEKLGNMSGVSLPTISSFHGTVDFVRATIEEDFGEPLVHPIHSMDLDDIDQAGRSGVGRTEQTETQRELEEGMELRERYITQGEVGGEVEA